MTKYEALKMLPLERFGDILIEIFKRSNDAEDFKNKLLDPFPDEAIPALQICSTGEDVTNAYATAEDSNNSHHCKVP